jgi:hypothetical protein
MEYKLVYTNSEKSNGGWLNIYILGTREYQWKVQIEAREKRYIKDFIPSISILLE